MSKFKSNFENHLHIKNSGPSLKDKSGPTSGEEYIAHYLKQINVKYISEKRIFGLQDDPASYRQADFYLPRYKLFVEFYGMWNNTKDDRERYRKKKNVYFKNNVPCVYIYPENLGILDYVFKSRSLLVLSKMGMRKELIRLKLKLFLNRFFWSYLTIGLLTFVWIAIWTNIAQEAMSLEQSFYYLTPFVIIGLILRQAKETIRFFRKGNMYLEE